MDLGQSLHVVPGLPVGALNLLTVAVLETGLGILEEPNAWTSTHQLG